MMWLPWYDSPTSPYINCPFLQDTTVEGNNFTAVSYYISVRITEEYVQVQVVNVSTGEFEGNVTVNL